MKHQRLSSLVAGAALLSSSTAYAAYPCSTVKIVTPFGPGQTFAVAEAIRDQLQEILGTTVAVESRPGARGSIGTSAVVRAAADGCTVLFGASSSLILPFAKKKPYDSLRDLRPVAFTIEAGPPVLLARGDYAGDFASVIAKAKVAPGTLNVGTNNGTLAHLAALQLFSLAGAKIQHVPFRSESEAVNQLLGGHVDFVVVLAPTALGPMQGKKARALIQIASERNRFIPDVPSTSDFRIAGADFRVYNSLFVPADTPDLVVEMLANAVSEAKARPSFIERMARQASVPKAGGPKEVETWLRATTASWAHIVDENGIERQ